METLTDRALGDGHLRLETVGKTEKIHYVAVSRTERWSDPEEKVRAEFYAELIYRYGYSPERIGVEVTVPDRSPNDFADLVVFTTTSGRSPTPSSSARRTASAMPSSTRRSNKPRATGVPTSFAPPTSASSRETRASSSTPATSTARSSATRTSSLTCRWGTVSHPSTSTARA